MPLHGGAPFVARSPGLGDDLGFVAVDIHTLQSKAAPNVFAIGDAASLPTSKAGSSTHFEGETLCANVERVLAGEQPQGSYDGHVNCFIESGFHKALLIDFDYEHEPLPGRFPEAHVGPLPLLRESRLNHLGKLAFQPLYWHMLLPGREIPGVGAEFSLAGKQPVPDQGGALEHPHLRRRDRRGRRGGVPHRPAAVERGGGGGDRRRERHRGADRPPLAGRRLHAGHLPGVGLGALDPDARQSLGRADQGALRAVPKGPAKLAAKIAGIPKPRGCI